MFQTPAASAEGFCFLWEAGSRQDYLAVCSSLSFTGSRCWGQPGTGREL